MRFIAALFLASVVSSLAGVERWADEKLPVKDGLALWLDASAERKAVANGKVEPGIWHDGSGHQRDAKQMDPANQPRWGMIFPVYSFGFDGKSQHFVVEALDWKMREATVMVFARAASNGGGFRGLVSASKPGANDYESGFNLDLGGKPTMDGITALNAEGTGFRGEQNLLPESVPFGKTFCATAIIGADQVSAYIGAVPQGSRPREKDSALDAGHLLIGARSLDNSGKSPVPTGFFDGDIFEVLIYDRALTADEVRRVNQYLTVKYAGVVYIAAAKKERVAGSVPLETVKNPPVIQPLVPGFSARKLTVSLSNCNGLAYHPDGRLFAGAYDGKIYTLRDTDGDGLEDKADVFYQSEDLKLVTGIALTPPGYPRGDGVFVSTRARILLILDKDHDGRGDEVVTVAHDWEKARVLGGGVSDALGVAVDNYGSVYFMLGTNDFTNAYLLDAATGKAGYRLAGERGTIQRVSPDFTKRETVCTGVRVMVGMAFNAQGDLFATEQEGATWLANGNPFDELIHVQQGRHYGFPPQHPVHLPDVVDEPSTFDYGPQHQSAVGLSFNEPVGQGNAVFGPNSWRGDALVAAMSRGKIYRTKLVKSAAGYVAKNETFAQLQRIIIDQAVSPHGDLAVTLHGGSPDWGTGPTGMGELWKISQNKVAVPRPVLAWSASPTEFRVAFDAPVTTEALAAMQGKVRVTQGRYVEAGDRFETMRPGYQAVKNQLATPRFPVAVESISLADNDRTLIFATAAQTAALSYGITIEADAFKAGDGTPYSGQIDLVADLTGLEAEWKSADGTAVKSWLPHPDFNVSRQLTAGNGDSFFNSFDQEGSITLRGQLDLGQMLLPSIQPGSKLDWEYPAEEVTVVLTATRPFSFTLGSTPVTSQPEDGLHEAAHTVTTKDGTWLPLIVDFPNGTGDPALTATWSTDRSATPRPFPLRRILMPYAKAQVQAAQPHNEDLPQLAGANAANGKILFTAVCAGCHQMRGDGGRVGPDLTNLIYRDYDSVLRDIRDPNAAINPEHVAYTVTKKDGSEITAVLLAENSSTISLAQIAAPPLEIQRSDIASMKQLAISLMPPGLDKAFNETQLRDLMSYLLLAPAK